MQEYIKKLPLSASQMRFYQDFKSNDGATVNTARLYKFNQPIDVQRLARAIEEALGNHAASSLRITVENNIPYQHIEPDYHYQQKIETMSDEEFLKEKEHFTVPFKMIDEPLFHSRLIETPSAVYWMFDINHIIVDASSRSTIYSDITDAYNGQPLPTEDWTPLDVAEDEQRFLASDKGKDAVDALVKSWRDCEGCFPSADINDDGFSVKLNFMGLDVDLEAMKTLTDKTKCSLSSVTAAACCLLLSLYAHNDNAALMTAFNCRRDEEVKHTVGMVTRYLLFSARWSADMTVDRFLQEAQRNTILGRENVKANLAAMNKLGKNFTDYMEFIFQGRASNHVIGNQQPELVHLSMDGHTELKPFNVHFLISGGKPMLMILWQGHRYSREFINEFVDRYQTILRGFISWHTIGEVIKLCDKH